MTERQQDRAAMRNDQREERDLSTADMAAAAERQRIDEDAVPVDLQETTIPAGVGAQGATQPAQLLSADNTQTFRSRWNAIQTGFVDEPRRAVEQADTLVAEVMQHLAQTFADERARLESQWSRGDDVSTEDLRVALQRYRSFFDRLLSM